MELAILLFSLSLWTLTTKEKIDITATKGTRKVSGFVARVLFKSNPA